MIKHLILLKIKNKMDISANLLQCFIIFYEKSSAGAIISKQQLAQELYKPFIEELNKAIIRKFEKRKLYSSFEDNIWSADLADMQLICKYKKRFQFLLCAIDNFSKYA